MDHKTILGRLIKWLRNEYPGLQIKMYDPYFSRVMFPTSKTCFWPDHYRIIIIACSSEVNNQEELYYKRILQLLHEAGHVEELDRRFRGDADKFMDGPVVDSEVRAYLYGWAIARKAIPEFVLSKKEWRGLNIVANRLFKGEQPI